MPLESMYKSALLRVFPDLHLALKCPRYKVLIRLYNDLDISDVIFLHRDILEGIYQLTSFQVIEGQPGLAPRDD